MSSSSSRLLPPNPGIETTPGGASLSFEVPANPVYCDGHFPGTPLVPGAVLAVWMLEAAEQAGLPKGTREVRNMKFRAPVHPGDPVTVTAKPADAGFRVAVHSGGRVCADALFIA